MDLTNQSWFEATGSRMDWAGARQRVLAENVANADTPGFVGQDVVSFEDHLDRVETFGRTSDVSFGEADMSWGGSFDGNQVILEEQLMLSGEAQGQFNLASQLYKKGHALIGLSVSGN